METKEILLDKKYEFYVQVSFTTNIYHLGVLKLSPDRITLEFSCEYNTNDTLEQLKHKYNTIICHHELWDYFTLFDLTRIRCEKGTLRPLMLKKTYVRATYTAKYVLLGNSSFVSGNELSEFKIYSQEITKWIGNTHKQEDIISEYENSSINSVSKKEFSVELTSDSELICSYDFMLYHNSPEQKAGIVFPPKISLIYKQLVDFSRINGDLLYLIDVFCFLIGRKISIQKIKVAGIGSLLDSKQLSLYFCYKQPDNQSTEIIFFPYGHDKRILTENIPEMPLAIFEKYFALTVYNKQLIRCFVNARCMMTSEDKFLIFFRLAEKLFCKKDSISEERLIKLFESIKPYLPENAYTNEQIKNMKQLRNDIAHANEYELNESELLFYINLLDVMVTYLFLTKYFEISDNILSLIMPRHAQIHGMVIPRIYSSNTQTEYETKDDNKEVE